MEHITLNDLCFTYPDGTEALSNINFSVAHGEFVTLCGLSGCGKSTLLRLMKPGLFPHGSMKGEVFFDGKLLSPEPDRDTAAGIGFVMQSPEAQLVTDKVWHELAFSCESVGMPSAEIRRRVGEMAGYFGLEELFLRETYTLSGGQKQLLCLASAAALHPELMLLDEPTSQLDPISAQNFIDAVRRLNRDFGITIIVAEHRLEEFLPVSDRVIAIDNGQVVADCVPSILAGSLPDKHPLCCALTASQRVFLAAGGKGAAPVSVREGRASRLCMDYLREHSVQLPEKFCPSGEPVVTIRKLHAAWDKKSPEVLCGVSMELYPGEIYALIGGNGSGKSTLLKALCGIIKPYSGRIKTRQGARLAYLPQELCMLFTHDRVCDEAPAEFLDKFDLGRYQEKNPLDLSGGERQRLALAKLLSGKPDVLLLDEPTKGMDAAARHSFSEMLRLLAENGLCVLLVTHDTELASECADMCGMLFNGEILNEAEPSEMFSGNYFYTTPEARLRRGV